MNKFNKMNFVTEITVVYCVVLNT